MGRAIRTEHANATEWHEISYGATSSTVSDSAGLQTIFNFGGMAYEPRRISSISRAGQTTSYMFEFGSQRRISQETDARGIVKKFIYSNDHLVSMTEAFGTAKARTTSYAYRSNYEDLLTLTTESGRATSFSYHPTSGNLQAKTVTDTTVTPSVARTWTYTHNTFGQVLTEDGPRTDVTDVTTWTYYTCTVGFQCGQVNTITNALGHVTTFNSYDAHAQPTQITDANGLLTSLSYDTRQRLTHRCVGGSLPSCAGGELMTLAYWPTGLIKKVTSPDGSFFEYFYDNAHRLTEIRDGALNRIVYTLDAAGNRTAQNTYDPSSNLKRTHTQVFNSLNQLWKDVNAAGTAAVTTTFGYDNNGNQTTTNAPLSRNSTNAYDELNRINQIVDPNSGVTAFAYDANDNLTSVTDPRSLVTSYTYTGFGDLKTQVSPDTGTTTNTYDSGGKLKTSTDARSAVTTYTYDAMNRVKTAAFKIGATTDQTITYTYDIGTNQKGRLTGASDANHGLAWTYDSRGRVVGRGQSLTGVTPTLSLGYGYNAFGQLASMVMPSGKMVAFGYNSNNQVTSITLNGSPNVTILSGVTYDPFGPIKGWTWGNGSATTSRSFDTDGKLSGINNTSPVGNRTFGFDDAFRITSTTDSASGGPAWTLGYDLLDRLNSATKIGTTIGYTYDSNGNRLTQTGTTASTSAVSPTSNRLSSVAGGLVRSYNYDNAGNLLGSGVTTHTYYNSGRMKTGKLGAAAVTNYVYNALGQRIKKSGGAILTPTYFMHDEAGHLVGEYTISGSAVTVLQETVWLGDIPVATLRPVSGVTTVFYVHTDQLNTPRKVTNTANVLRWKWDPTPFGEGIPAEPAGAFKYNLRFPGQYFDVESNLNYNYFRDYDPTIGRYTESDPIGIKAGVNTYAYVRLKPQSKSDPRGLCDDCEPDRAHFRYKSDAAKAMLRQFNPRSIVEDIEYCGNLCRDRKSRKYFAMQESRGTPAGCQIMAAQSCPSCSVRVGMWHTHGAYHDDNHDGIDDFNADHFSTGPFADTYTSNNLGIDSYLGTPGGRFLFHGRNTGDSEIDLGSL